MQLQALEPNLFTKGWRSSPLLLVTQLSLSAFVIYTCMYGFRKPYTVATYEHVFFLGVSYKVCLVIAQVLGYMCSKFYGIRFISGLSPHKRARYLLIFIGVAWLSLFLFAVIPAPYNILCMFLNGLPLGMVFGLVFGYLEGRTTTEIMGAFLATSFIFASGLAKSIGKWLILDFHVSDWWMPFCAGSVFILPFVLAVRLLQKAPPPSATDIAARSERKPMTQEQRRAFLSTYGRAIAPIVLAYAIFTIIRDFVEDFANELWIETGYKNNAGIFAQQSTMVALIVLVVVASFFTIKNNFKAFTWTHYLILLGLLLTASATFLFNIGILAAAHWMLIATTGLYFAYLPFNCLYFERMLSSYKIRGNVGFVMYIADAFGYLGTVLVLLIKEFIPIHYSWINFFSFLFYTATVLGSVFILAGLFAHRRLHAKLAPPSSANI